MGMKYTDFRSVASAYVTKNFYDLRCSPEVMAVEDAEAGPQVSRTSSRPYLPPELSQSDYPAQQRRLVEMQKQHMKRPAEEERQPQRARNDTGNPSHSHPGAAEGATAPVPQIL